MNLTEARDTIVKEIIIKGSAERIFEALTNPDQRIKWWGAEGRFQTTEMESDLRPGVPDFGRLEVPLSGFNVVFGVEVYLRPLIVLLRVLASVGPRGARSEETRPECSPKRRVSRCARGARTAMATPAGARTSRRASVDS